MLDLFIKGVKPGMFR
uniref:Uncharacterized protein n=1 Tax=Anguilla anguilla TaxID=7936 RepID=A0A0E9UPE9_ANGAN